MATNEWRGDAQPRAQVDLLIPGTIEIGDKLTVTINRKDYSYTIPDDTESDTDTGLVSAVVGAMVSGLIEFSDTVAEFSEVTWTVGTTTFNGVAKSTHIVATGPDDGKPVTITTSTNNVSGYDVIVTEAVKGVTGKNEIQKVSLPASTDGGTFTLTWNGQTTGTIAWNASAATLQTALENLSNIAPGDVIVLKGGLIWTVEFAATYAQQDVALMTGSGSGLTGTGEVTVSVETLTEGSAAVNEIQRVTIPSAASGGTFTLTYDGQTTAGIAYNASTATVVSSLEALSNIGVGDVAVTQSGTQYFVEFKGAFKGTNVPLMTANGASLTGACTVSVATTTDGGPGTNELGLLTFTPAPWNVSQSTGYKLTFTNPSNVTSSSGWIYEGAASSSSTMVSHLQRELDLMTSVGAGNTVVSVRSSTDDEVVLEIEFVGSLAATNVNSFTVTAQTGCIAPTYSVDVEGSPTDVNEVQVITLVGGPTGGTFTLTFSGQTTAGIAYNASAGTVQTALEALSNIAPGDVAITGSAGGPYTCTFGGVYAGVDVSQMTGSGASLTGGTVTVATTQDSVAGINEVERVKITGTATGGTFKLIFNGETTGTIAYNASPATVQTALEGLATPVPGDFSVTGGDGGPWTVEFKGNYAATNVDAMTTTANALTGGTVTITTIQTYAVARNEQQVVQLETGVTGGTFTLTFNAETTSTIAWNASAATVQTALEGLATPVPGDFSVAGASGGPWTVTFTSAYAARDVAMMVGNGASLTGPGTQSFVVVSSIVPTGPEWADEPENWSLGTALASTEIGVFRVANRPVKYGMSNASVVPAELHFYASFQGAGLPDDTGEYIEYRNKELKYGTNGAGTLKVYVGEGDGPGCSILRLNTGTKQTDLYVYKTNFNGGSDSPVMTWDGTHASNQVFVAKGDVGIGFYNAATTVSLLTIGYLDSRSTDGAVKLGNAVTLATVKQYGGTFWSNSAITTSFTQTSGTSYLMGTGAVAQVTLDGDAYCYYSTTGTLGGNTYVANEAVIDFSQDDRTKTVTNSIVCYWSDGVRDPNKVVTSLIVDYYRASPNEHLGQHIRVTRGAVP